MPPTIKTIAEYETQQDYFVDFFGDNLLVTQTETPSVIRRWIRYVVYRHRHSRSRHHPLVVGVGVQWTPPWYFSAPECYYYRPADTLQLCVGTMCLIIHLSHCYRVPDILRRFLTDPDTTFVGIRNSQDAKRLARSRHQLEIGELLDVRYYYTVTDSGGGRFRPRSFEETVEGCMGLRGVRLDENISKSDWSGGYLSHDQLLQASVDAYVCYKLGVDARVWEV